MQQAGGEQAQQAQEMLKDQVNNFFSWNQNLLWKLTKLTKFLTKFFIFQDKLVEEIFSHEDKDKDGYISHEEFSGPKHDEL